MPKQLSQLRSEEIAALSRENTVFFLTVAPLEDHGPHLPVGLDGIEAVRFAEKVAEKVESTLPGWQVVFLPLAPLGIETNTSQFSVRVRGHVLRDYLVDACESLHRSGFKKFVCFSGHPGPQQLTAIEEAGKLFRKRHSGWFFFGGKNAPSLVSANSVVIDDAQNTTAPIFTNPPEHGGKRDTSVALAFAPTLVSPEYRTLPRIEREGSAFDRFMKHRRGGISGYWGAPNEATPAEGERLLNEKIETVVTKLRAVWEGSNPAHVFKSWFSIYPVNRSLFRVWVLIFALFLILGAWLILAFQSMMSGAEF